VQMRRSARDRRRSNTRGSSSSIMLAWHQQAPARRLTVVVLLCHRALAGASILEVECTVPLAPRRSSGVWGQLASNRWLSDTALVFGSGAA
jgi:hypothetical protein